MQMKTFVTALFVAGIAACGLTQEEEIQQGLEEIGISGSSLRASGPDWTTELGLSDDSLQASTNNVGAPCTNFFMPCAPDAVAQLTSCGGFSSACDSTGTQEVLDISFICLPTGASGTCTAIAGQQSRIVSCVVPTNGNSCSKPCGAPFCDYPTQCANSGPRVQTCFTNGTCSNDVCTGLTSFRQTVGSCSRLTEGQQCSAGPPCFLGRCTAGGSCSCNPIP